MRSTNQDSTGSISGWISSGRKGREGPVIGKLATRILADLMPALGNSVYRHGWNRPSNVMFGFVGYLFQRWNQSLPMNEIALPNQ